MSTWISVQDRLPAYAETHLPPEQMVIVLYTDTSGLLRGAVAGLIENHVAPDDGDVWYDEQGDRIRGTVICWMPIPKQAPLTIAPGRTCLTVETAVLVMLTWLNKHKLYLPGRVTRGDVNNALDDLRKALTNAALTA